MIENVCINMSKQNLLPQQIVYKGISLDYFISLVQELRDAEKELETSSESDYDYWLYRVHGLQIKIDLCLNNFKI
jgi:hypothetical protein